MLTDPLILFVILLFALSLAILLTWSRERRADRSFRERQLERGERHAREEADKKEKEAEEAREETRYQNYVKNPTGGRICRS